MNPRYLFAREYPSPSSPSASSPVPSPLDPATLKGSDPATEFLLVEESRRHTPANAFTNHFSAQTTSTDLVIRAVLEKHHPHLTLTVSRDDNCDIFGYASTGEISLAPAQGDCVLSKLVFKPSARRADGPGSLAVAVDFGRFVLEKNNKEFVCYFATWSEGFTMVRANYFVHNQGEKHEIEDVILQACAWTLELHEEVLVFKDGMWVKDHDLWKSVQKADWKDVILDPAMKKRVQDDVNNFFSNSEVYEQLGVPWKRGVIFHGPPGNGKTISIKALMRNSSVPSLYVKSFRSFMGEEYGMAIAFAKARAFAPCILILEDLDSLINPLNRSFFLNELDGIVENDGILVLGTTNHLELLDPGIVNRPSRFDRKYYFPLPSLEERKMYCEYWQIKLKGNEKIEFPDELVQKIADWTPDFSFAYLKEAFVSSLLLIAAMDKDGDGKEEPGLFERIIKEQIESLKEEILPN